MGTPTPWQVAGRRFPPKSRRIETYAYDPYNFSHVTTTNGTNVTLVIPCTGPNSAGAPPPTSVRTVTGVTIIVTGGTDTPGYGNNFGTPPA